MSGVIKSGYTRIYPKWLAPSGNIYHIEGYELKRCFTLFKNGVPRVEKHKESDMLLLWLLKNELGWSGNLRLPLSPQDVANLRLLEQAMCLTYQGIFTRDCSE